ncbi:MAG: sulfatase-like hydrolase/transferase [Vicinamibacterales bacterium]
MTTSTARPTGGRTWLVAGVALLAVAGAWAAWRTWPARSGARNVLVVTLDTMRPDHLGSYGYGPAQTPILDDLAARGARFASATTVVPLTLPSHTSLFTGTFPGFHTVRDNGGFYVDEARVTLAEVLKGRGYRTGAFVSAFVLDGRWGLPQGFDDYYDNFDLPKDVQLGMDAIQRPGEETVDRALAWLSNDRQGAPFFLWVHLYDAHAPYNAPPAYRSRFPEGIDGAYDAEVAYVDAQVGRLLAAVKSTPRGDDTIVVVVGDHGEMLGEHREQAHGFFVYDAAVQIPLIIAGPGVAPRVVRDQVRIVDVMPTILSMVGAPTPPEVQGTTLTPALEGQRLDLVALAETWYPRYHYGWSELTTIRDGRYKFISAPRRELYDLEQDPKELTNLADANPARADALERQLGDMVARLASTASAKGPADVDPEVEERLRALGYVGASVSPRTLEDRPRGDPKDKIELYNALKMAGTDSTQGRLDAAIAKVTTVLQADGEVVEAYTMLGNLHTKAERHAAAVEAYKRALALDPEHKQATFNLALAYKSLGKSAEAEAGFIRSTELDPRSGKAFFQLGDIYMHRGELEKAAALLQKGLDQHVERPAFLVKLGEVYIELKRPDDAERALEEALSLERTVPRANFDLGLVSEERGDAAAAQARYEAELSANPTHSGANFNLGKLLLRQNRRADAIARFRAAVESEPAFGEGHLFLAKALLDSGDLAGAETSARRGLEAHASRALAPLGHYVLADVYSRLGRDREAAREVAAARGLERSQ